MAILEIENLTKVFGGLTAVDHVTFNVEDHQICGLIGPNGAGKTTLFNLITGVYKMTEGKAVFLGQDLTGLPPYKIADMGLTRTFQNIRLFKKLSVYDNVLTACHLRANYSLAEGILFGAVPASLDFLIKGTRYAREEQKIQDEAEKLLELMGLSDRRDFVANNLPYGLQRRLEIARALALNPKLLILDEPAAGMNPEETDRLMELIVRLRDEFNLAILLIEHHMDLVMGCCENIVVINFGKMIAEGNAAEIQSNKLVKEAYLGEEEVEIA